MVAYFFVGRVSIVHNLTGSSRYFKTESAGSAKRGLIHCRELPVLHPDVKSIVTERCPGSIVVCLASFPFDAENVTEKLLAGVLHGCEMIGD
jgi:hypothetical protein